MTSAHAGAGKNIKNAVVNSGPFSVPGFRVAAAQSGMRYKGRPDVALIVAESRDGAVAAGVFTKNRFTAAPVEICRTRIASGRAGAILVNAGIANACTGHEGITRATESSKIAADALNIPEDSVLVASTGVIGMQLEVGPIADVMQGLVADLRQDGWTDVARAIMTTDLVEKMASVQFQLGGKTVTVGGVAKGSGMIAPNMATLLAFVCTDAAVTPEVLDQCVRQGADRSFNSITVDGDTSTNDTLIVLASGSAGNDTIKDAGSPEARVLADALFAVLLELSRKIVLDGEGATKFIEIEVIGAADESAARAVAMTIANSPLVKTAFFGQDANWGRIVAAAGRAGIDFDPGRVSLFFDDVCVFRDGAPLLGKETEERASRVFRKKELVVRLDLGSGPGEYRAHTCDLSYDYIKINASYRS